MINAVAKTCSIFLTSLLFLHSTVESFSMSSNGSKSIYGVPNSGWKSPDWNWGSAIGTGHDCAKICRQTYATEESRRKLVANLLDGKTDVDFEEVKLILALVWQRGRWDGSDGGRGGYGDVLFTMAQASRYEDGSDEECSERLVNDMRDRFGLLRPSDDQKQKMDMLWSTANDVLMARSCCSGLVLQATAFIENGC